MESKIKIYRPPIDEAIVKLLKLAEKLPTISEGNLSRGIIPSGETIMGDFDFVFHWAKDPDGKKLRELISQIDSALNGIGCRYTVTTTVDSSYPYKI